MRFAFLLDGKGLPPTCGQTETANLVEVNWAAIGSATMSMSGQMVE